MFGVGADIENSITMDRRIFVVCNAPSLNIFSLGTRVGHLGMGGLGKTRLLRVTLRAQPSNAAVAVHPLVDFRFAFEARDLNRLDTRTFGHDIPIAVGNSHWFEMTAAAS
jgi:hypothetical protein